MGEHLGLSPSRCKDLRPEEETHSSGILLEAVHRRKLYLVSPSRCIVVSSNAEHPYSGWLFSSNHPDMLIYTQRSSAGQNSHVLPRLCHPGHQLHAQDSRCFE